MKRHKSDIIIACIIILILTYFIPGPNFLHYGVLFVLIFLCLPSLGRKEEDFWENRSHDDSEIETPSQSDYERPSYSLRVDESLFWENQHRDDDLESKTDYSQVDPCFRGDKKVSR